MFKFEFCDKCGKIDTYTIYRNFALCDNCLKERVEKDKKHAIKE